MNFQSAAKLKELQDQLNITLTKTHRKVNSLKSQFTEHKKKWETVSVSALSFPSPDIIKKKFIKEYNVGRFKW